MGGDGAEPTATSSARSAATSASKPKSEAQSTGPGAEPSLPAAAADTRLDAARPLMFEPRRNDSVCEGEGGERRREFSARRMFFCWALCKEVISKRAAAVAALTHACLCTLAPASASAPPPSHLRGNNNSSDEWVDRCSNAHLGPGHVHHHHHHHHQQQQHTRTSMRWGKTTTG